MRVLVVGGTGGFGATICRLLAAEGHVVTAAGRDAGRGMRLTREMPDVRFRRIDRDLISPSDLRDYEMVVDAAGPFRGQDRRLARTAIAAGRHHLDISDDRAFAVGVSDLDADARRAGVVCLSGASSVPTLSCAVAVMLSRGLDAVHHVEAAISASSQAAFGRSVLHSMLSGAGHPIYRSDGSTGTAMTDRRAMTVDHAGRPALRRTVLEVDGPDQDEMPGLLPGHPSIRFRAGGELGIHNLAMHAVACAVSSGLLRDGARLLPLTSLVRRITARQGDGRSAMTVELIGDIGGTRVSRRWSLLAERNMGPMIPCLVVPALVDAIAAGAVAPGARSAAGALGVDEILSRLPEGAITTETSERAAPPLYASLPGWDRMHSEIREMHDFPAFREATGSADIVRGTGMLSRLVAYAFRFPPAGADVPVTVRFEPHLGGERWTRTFGRRSFRSTITSVPGGLRERFGPFVFRFRIEERDGELAMVPLNWSAFGLPMPQRLMPDGVAVERGVGGCFEFDVPIRMPLIGLVVHYRGLLTTVPRGRRSDIRS